MSCRRLKLPEFSSPSATVATPATILSQDPRSVANVATVASPELVSEAPDLQSLQTIAGVARVEPKEERLSIGRSRTALATLATLMGADARLQHPIPRHTRRC